MSQYQCPLLILVVFTAVTASQELKLANDYIDEEIKNIKSDRDTMSKIEPLPLPRIKESNLEIWDGWLRGLSYFHRYGNSTMRDDGENFVINTDLAVDDLKAEQKYRFRFKVGFWWTSVSGNIKISLKRLVSRLTASIHKENRKVKVKEFKVTEFNHLKVEKITGLSFVLNWALKIIAQRALDKVKENTRSQLESEVRPFLENELKAKVPS